MGRTSVILLWLTPDHFIRHKESFRPERDKANVSLALFTGRKGDPPMGVTLLDESKDYPGLHDLG